MGTRTRSRMSEQHRTDGTSSGFARYEIRLGGLLHERWAAWFDGLTVTHSGDGTTVISGDIADQAALHGLLQRVRDLGVPLVSVERIETDAPGPSGSPPMSHR
jgi:hypothetical protein